MAVNSEKCFIISTLAMYQTPFYVELARCLKDKGAQVTLVSFHQRSADYIREKGFECLDVFSKGSVLRTEYEVDAEFLKIVNQLGISNPTILISHEKVTFGERSSAKLKKKFINYFSRVNELVKERSKDYEVVVIQETGGFTSLLSLYYAALNNGASHYFMEPSFYKGRLFFVENSLKAPRLEQKPSLSEEELVKLESYIETTLEKGQIVVPEKDQGHYRSPLKKVLNLYNGKRLFQKLIDKYFLGKKEEFNYIGSFVFRHLRMTVNRILFSFLYKKYGDDESYVYYPFHVPMDMSLTIRAPHLLDQYTLVDTIARSIPANTKLVIKEHPAMIGVLSFVRVLSLLRNNENIVFLHPSENNYSVMRKAEMIITVNSKSGAEALLLGKQVIFLGDSFYRESGLGRRVDHLETLAEEIDNFSKEKEFYSEKKVKSFFEKVWSNSIPGELYTENLDNVKNLSEELWKTVCAK